MAAHMTGRHSAGPELVPLADRARHMQRFRPIAGAATIALALFASGAQPSAVMALAAGTVVYLAVTTAAGWGWRRMESRGLALFGGMLLLDGFYLAWSVDLSGGSASPVRYVILLHVIAVALLASYRTSLKLALWHGLLAVVVYQAHHTGVLSSVASPGNQAGGEPQKLAVFIAVLGAVALTTATFSAVNERELRRRRFDLEALARFSAEIEATATPDAIGAALVRDLADAFGFHRVLLLTSPSGVPQVLAQQGCASALLGHIGRDPGSLFERVRRHKTTLLASTVDTSVDTWLAAAMPAPHNLIVVPLSAEEQVVGALLCERPLSSGSRVEQRVVAMVERFASHAALALRSRWLLQEIRDAAATDGLTGIRNRRAFDDRLEEELARAERSGDPLSLVMLDIDHFKRLNDDHGHQCGDDVLREVGAVLAAHCRKSDIPARYGGEEFAVILPFTERDTALAIAERLRGLVASADAPVAVTVSVGVATAMPGLHEPDILIAAADSALYQSKHAGRDRVTAAAAITASLAPTAEGGFRRIGATS